MKSLTALSFLIMLLAPLDSFSAPQSEKGAVQQKVLSFNLEGMTQKGAKSWEVKGESAEALSESQIRLDNITAKTYGKEGEATITADNGIYDKSKNNVMLENNVKATIINSENFSQGQDIPSKKKRKIVITCDGEVQFDYEKNQAYFNDNVKVVSDDGNIDADKITVNLDSSTKKIHNIVAEGNVKITRGENITYSDKATYIEGDKKIVLTGRPKLIIYQEGDIDTAFINE